MYPNKLSIEAFPSTLQLGYFTPTGQGPLTDDPGRYPQEESSIDAKHSALLRFKPLLLLTGTQVILRIFSPGH